MTRPKNPLKTLQDASVSALLAQVRMLSRAQRDLARAKGDDGKPIHDPAALKRLGEQASAVGRGAAALLAEARKQETADNKAAGKKTPAEKVTMIIEQLPGWPVEERRRLAEALAELGGGL